MSHPGLQHRGTDTQGQQRQPLRASRPQAQNLPPGHSANKLASGPMKNFIPKQILRKENQGDPVEQSRILRPLARAHRCVPRRRDLLPPRRPGAVGRDTAGGPGSTRVTCPLALVFLASTLLVFSKLLWVGRWVTGPFNIFNGFF